jgi:ketosteroid isomerase-like protein
MTALLLMTFARADATQDLIRLEQQLTDALARSDAQLVNTLWADDLVWIGINAKASSKPERLAGMKTPDPSVISAKNNEMKVRIYGDTAVVTVSSTWTTRSGNVDSKVDYMATHVWTKRRGKWQLVSAQIARATNSSN